MQSYKWKGAGRAIRCLLLAVLVVGLAGCSSTAPPEEMPEDFDFVLQFNHAFMVGTYAGTLTERDLHEEGSDYVTAFSFTEEQMQSIYAEFRRLRIYRIEDGADVGKTETIPPLGVNFAYTLDGRTTAVFCSDSHIPADGAVPKEKRDFVEFTDFIQVYVEESEAYQSAPQITYGLE